MKKTFLNLILNKYKIKSQIIIDLANLIYIFIILLL